MMACLLAVLTFFLCIRPACLSSGSMQHDASLRGLDRQQRLRCRSCIPYVGTTVEAVPALATTPC